MVRVVSFWCAAGGGGGGDDLAGGGNVKVVLLCYHAILHLTLILFSISTLIYRVHEAVVRDNSRLRPRLRRLLIRRTCRCVHVEGVAVGGGGGGLAEATVGAALWILHWREVIWVGVWRGARGLINILRDHIL